MTAVGPAILGALLIGALNTLGDLTWAGLAISHHPVFGLLHGLVLCLGIGGYLGEGAAISSAMISQSGRLISSTVKAISGRMPRPSDWIRPR